MPPLNVESATRTLLDLAAHMDRLRVQATAFQKEFETRERGYFSPSEDDAVLGLWVSYHKARNALLELIETIRAEVGEASRESVVEFTLGYGAAIVLVDAARFLRDLFGQDTIVRRKLNESSKLYGIPPGSFDAIQMSLTDPATALKIKKANEFYDQHADLIRAAAEGDEDLGRLLDALDARAERIRVSTSRYVKVRIADRRRQLNEMIVQAGVLRAIYAIQETGSRFVSSLSTKPRHVPKLPDAIATEIRELIRPGDVFVTRKENAVTNYFLPGYWPHAAMYIGDGHVIESLKDGVRERTLDSPFGNDAVAVLRPTLDKSLIEQSIKRARTHLGKPYDFDFDFTRADRMVCTEVVYRSYEGLGGVVFKLSTRAGRQTLSAEDLLQVAIAGTPFRMLAVYCPQHADTLLTDQKMYEILEKTIAQKRIAP